MYYKHGKCRTPEYRAWDNAKARCYNRKHERYSQYGGRGIQMCNRWVQSFDAFLDDMGHRPTPQHSLDRINNDGDYTPSNCKWSTKKEQGRNRSTCRHITYCGITKTIAQWAEELNVNYGTFRSKLEHCSEIDELFAEYY